MPKPIFNTALAASKNEAHLKSSQKCLKNKYLLFYHKFNFKTIFENIYWIFPMQVIYKFSRQTNLISAEFPPP